ncbi:MAG: hypothetical protein O6940_03035, partial [Ignavibacteria bacterium]|nr:hypothetical protein [Ignavibacteria bacterium]
MPTETKPEPIAEIEKPTLSYEQIELPYQLEKMAKKETSKINTHHTISTENNTPATIVETTVSQPIHSEKKVTLDKTPSEKSRPDLAQLAIDDHITKAFSDNASKQVKIEEPRPKMEQPLNFSLEPSKPSPDTTSAVNYNRPKVSDPLLKECRPPKPSLSAIAQPKMNHASVDVDSKDNERKGAFTCINIKSVDRPSNNSHKNSKNTTSKKSMEVVRTIESVRIIDLSVGKNNKAESITKLPTSSPLDIMKESDDSEDQVVDLCIKTSPVKNEKLDQEMDKVMNDLLEISRNILGTPEHSPQPTVITPPPHKNVSPTIPRYRDSTKGDMVSTNPIRKGTSEQNHSVITSTSKPVKAYSTDFMDAYKSSLAKTETASLHRQTSEAPYKPKTVFQESYLAQNLPSKMSPKPQPP